jgi:hypothetical protein
MLIFSVANILLQLQLYTFYPEVIFPPFSLSIYYIEIMKYKFQISIKCTINEMYDILIHWTFI